MKNILGRELPKELPSYGTIKPFTGVHHGTGTFKRCSVKRSTPDRSGSAEHEGRKLLSSLKEAVERCGLRNGMTISFHHHLRNGDYVMNQVLEVIAEAGIKEIVIAPSSIFAVHAPVVEYMKNGVVTGIYTAYMSGPVAEAVSKGMLKTPAVLHTHGGRARMIESGDLHIDIAFIAAPACDEYGNLNGTNGPSACGALGYAVADATFADWTVAVTDHLVPYPACPIEIDQSNVDYVVQVEKLGDPNGIVSGTTKITKDPVGLIIAKRTVELMVASGLLKNGLSFQTGAGGTSLAVATYLREHMLQNGIQGSFAAGGITGYLVDMLEEGLFHSLFDVQCFDLKAVQSYSINPRHQPMSASLYGNPENKGAVVDRLDVMILGATEIDTAFNVNVITGSNGVIMGGSGGHSDTAAGAKLAIVVTQLTKGRLPIVVDQVTTVTTPGETIDAVVTERGIAIHPARTELIRAAKAAGLPVMTIEQLKVIAEGLTGKPEQIQFEDQIVAVVEYRDGTVIDVVRRVKE